MSLFLYALAAHIGVGELAKMVAVAAAMVKGLTETLFMLIYAMVADTFDTGDERGMVFSLLQTSKSCMAAFVIGYPKP